MTPTSATRSNEVGESLRPIVDLRFLVALGILIANDHWWKATSKSFLTGKISDFAGPVVAGVLLESSSDSWAGPETPVGP